MIGKRFGRLIVLARAENKGRRTAYRCKCDCGQEKIVTSENLVAGHTKSCGCINRERLSARSKEQNTTHGMSHTRIYRIWTHMRSRCNLERHERYHEYGGKGIKVCPEWDDFKAFYAWAMENGYDDTKTIDRIDNNKGYSPSNCRWTDYQTQNNNRDYNVMLTFNGKTMTVAEWARETGINDGTLRARLFHMGWSIEKALTTPTRKSKHSQ
jgi:hypothetical protein